MVYRAVVDVNNVVICIGEDEGQVGVYEGVGTWCDFTFSEIPVLGVGLMDEMLAQGKVISGLKVVDGEIVSRSSEEIRHAYETNGN